MATTTTTPQMGLILPNVGQELEPTASTDNNAAFTAVDSHDHSSGKGVKVTVAGININGDLDLNQFNLINARGVRLKDNVSTFSSADKDIIYDKDGDIWWNNHSGTAVQITSGAALNSGVASSVFSEVIKTTNYSILVGDTYTLILVDSSGGAKTVTLPAASGVAAGRYYVIKDQKASAATNNITVILTGADTIDTVAANKVLNTAGASLWFVSDHVSNWNTIGGSVPATASVAGVIRLTGDLSGTSATPIVSRINGSTVPAGGGLTTGNTLKVSGAGSLTYSALNVGGGAAYVSGRLPITNIAKATSPFGDVANMVLSMTSDASDLQWSLLTNVNIDSAAGIAGTKISPNFGSQAILTSGDMTSSSVTCAAYKSGSNVFLFFDSSSNSRVTLTVAEAGQNNILWDTDCQSVQYKQANTGSATGALMTFQAQNALTTGGGINIISGTGGTAAGAIHLYCGASEAFRAVYSSGLLIGFFGSQHAQATDIGTFIDYSGGAVNLTLAAISDTATKNAVASLAAQLNKLEVLLHNYGLTT